MINIQDNKTQNIKQWNSTGHLAQTLIWRMGNENNHWRNQIRKKEKKKEKKKKKEKEVRLKLERVGGALESREARTQSDYYIEDNSSQYYACGSQKFVCDILCWPQLYILKVLYIYTPST